MTQARVRSAIPQEATSTLWAKLGHLSTAARLVIGLLLLTTAGLKIYQAIWIDPAPARWLVMLAVTVDLAMGVWLISGLTTKLSHLSAMAVFVIFALVNLVQFQSGHASCGCYGPVEMDPLAGLLVNLTVLLALTLTLPRHRDWFTPRPRTGIAITAALTLGALAFALTAMGMDRREPFDPDHPTQRIVYVEPDQWLGQTLPLLSGIDQGKYLRHGHWEVIFFKHDCSTCLKSLEQALAKPAASPRTRRMLIEVPPFGRFSKRNLAENAGWRYARLTDQREWFFPVPTMIELQDSVVISVNGEGPAAKTPSAEPASDAVEQQPVASEPDPKADEVVFAEPFDVGYIARSATRHFTMTVTNPLNRDLTIRRTAVACDCTKILEVPEVLSAGQTIELPIQFDALPNSQRYTSKMVLYTTDANFPAIELTVNARIGIPLAITPQTLDVQSLATEGEVGLAVRNDSDRPIRLLYSSNNLEGVNIIAAVPRSPIEPGAQITLPIRITGDPVNPNQLRGHLRIHTNADEQQTLSVPIR